MVERSRKRVWSGKHGKWVWAGHAWTCPLCKEVHGGSMQDKAVPKGEKVCNSHTLSEFKHLPKKLWPGWAR